IVSDPAKFQEQVKESLSLKSGSSVDKNFASQLVATAMVKILMSITSFLFDNDHIEKTMETMRKLEKNSLLPKPFFLLYRSEDKIYLEDVALLHGPITSFIADTPITESQLTTQAKKMQSSGALTKQLSNQVDGSQGTVSENQDPDDVKVQGVWGDAWNNLKSAGSFIGKKTGITTAADAVGSVISEGAGYVAEGADDVGDVLSGPAESFGSAISNSFLGKWAGTAGSWIGDVSVDAGDAIANEAESIASTIKSDADICASGLKDAANWTKNAPVLGDIYEAVVEVGKAIIESSETMAEILYNTGKGFVKMTGYFVRGLTKAALDAVHGHFLKALGDVGGGLLSALEELAATFLSDLTICLHGLLIILDDALKALAYLLNAVVQIVEYLVEGMAFDIGFIAGGFSTSKGESWYLSTKNWEDSHQRTMNAIVLTVIMVALAPETGGASLAFLIITTLPQLVGSYQQDEYAILEKKQEHKQVENLQTYIANNEAFIPMKQDAALFELYQKYSQTITNQTRGLGFFQNSLNNMFDTQKESQENALGKFYMSLLATDTYGSTKGISPGDLGYMYGIKTDWWDLNPSQGFAAYSNARGIPCQELAVAVSHIMKPVDGPSGVTFVPGEAKFWFLQRAVKEFDKPINEVEIAWRPIQLLNEHNIGVMVGGTPIGKQQVLQTHKGNLNTGQLSKILTYTRSSFDLKAKIGLYEHESELKTFNNGWYSGISQSNVPILNIGHWYHMKIILNGTNLSASLWDEKNPGTKWTSGEIKVSETDQTNLGIVYSGAAIEFKIISLNNKPYTQKPTIVRKNMGYRVESTREKIAKAQLDIMLNPSTNKISLNSLGRYSIIKKQFIYTTNSTNLLPVNGTPETDYVIYGQEKNKNLVSSGLSPVEKNSNCIISLVTEIAHGLNALDKIAICKDILASYTTKHVNIDQNILTAIENKRKKYINSLMGPFSFGKLTLLPASQNNIEQGFFIYKTITPVKELKLPATAKELAGISPSIMKNIYDNESGNLYDFVVMSQGKEQLGKTTPINNIGMQFSADSEYAMSLVTGFVYDNIHSKTAFEGYKELDFYTSTIGSPSKNLMAQINGVIGVYSTMIQEEAAAKKAAEEKKEEEAEAKLEAEQEASVPPIPTNPTTISTDGGGPDLGGGSQFPDAEPSPSAQQSIQQRQNSQGFGGNTSLGGDGSLGGSGSLGGDGSLG
ncbi:hypothetical protein HN446_04695, partial [bacterium]|nr:hypothetical protein [bacterium]